MLDFPEQSDEKRYKLNFSVNPPGCCPFPEILESQSRIGVDRARHWIGRPLTQKRIQRRMRVDEPLLWKCHHANSSQIMQRRQGVLVSPILIEKTERLSAAQRVDCAVAFLHT